MKKLIDTLHLSVPSAAIALLQVAAGIWPDKQPLLDALTIKVSCILGGTASAHAILKNVAGPALESPFDGLPATSEDLQQIHDRIDNVGKAISTVSTQLATNAAPDKLRADLVKILGLPEDSTLAQIAAAIQMRDSMARNAPATP